MAPLKFIGHKEECYSLRCINENEEELLCITFAIFIDEHGHRTEVGVEQKIAIAENVSCTRYKNEHGDWCIPTGCVWNGFMGYQCTDTKGKTYFDMRYDPVCFGISTIKSGGNILAQLKV